MLTTHMLVSTRPSYIHRHICARFYKHTCTPARTHARARTHTHTHKHVLAHACSTCMIVVKLIDSIVRTDLALSWLSHTVGMCQDSLLDLLLMVVSTGYGITRYLVSPPV